MSGNKHTMNLSTSEEPRKTRRLGKIGQLAAREHDKPVPMASNGVDSMEGDCHESLTLTPPDCTLADAGISEAMVDALSSSLASIAATGNTERARVKADLERRLRNGSQDGGEIASSSSGSDGRGNATGVNVVTTGSNPTTSSGDDRDSSATGNGCGVVAAGNKSSSGDDHDSCEGDKVQPQASTITSPWANQQHQRKRPPIGSVDAVEDPYGLPTSLNDRVQAESVSTHATVVAHLPPPSLDTTSSAGSGVEVQKSKSGDRTRARASSLLESPHEPGFHTIRQTFNKLAQREAQKPRKSRGSTGHGSSPYKHKKSLTHPSVLQMSFKEVKFQRRHHHDSQDDAVGSGSSSGSGTEDGYAASVSSNELVGNNGSCSSPSVSSDECLSRRRRRTSTPYPSCDPLRPMLSKKLDYSSVSSDLADFSSGASDGDATPDGFTLNSFGSCATASSLDEHGAYMEGQDVSHHRRPASSMDTKLPANEAHGWVVNKRARTTSVTDPELLLSGKPPIMALGCDIMAHVLTFLEPPNTMDILTMPLSKDWLNNFTRQPELWRVLCLLDPFKADVEEEDESDDSVDSFPLDVGRELRVTFGKSRLLYTSFVRCMRYLARIEDDALHGRAPSTIDYGATGNASHNIGANQNLKHFLSRARGVVVGGQDAEEASKLSDISDVDNNNNQGQGLARHIATAGPIGVSDNGKSTQALKRQKETDATFEAKKKPTAKFGQSQITQRLLGPTADGQAGNKELPWSCAIYSIVNWMVAFPDVEGIQTMCLKVLSCLLEDEQQRSTAQRAGLTDIILRDMVFFPNSAQLHSAAFHTIVLLARPIGGREGMLFHTPVVNSSVIFSSTNDAQGMKNGIAVMLDSMRRFRSDEVLQAMSCWALVNIALEPTQKKILVKLGGIEVTANAMMEHPLNAEVQFRALFALINLVIPSVEGLDSDSDAESLAMSDGSETEKEMLDETVDQIAGLVVTAMKNFCSSEAILNRACLVLHNLSLTDEYHSALLSTPNCYQMLEWCLGNYLTDQVLQQSASGTVHRLQSTLSSDEILRARFTATLEAQHKQSLEQAHSEAGALRLQQREQQVETAEPS